MARRKKDEQQAAIFWAREVLSTRDFVIVDTETTGLSDAEIVQISVLSAYGLPLLDAILKPQRPIPEEASRIHHLTDTDVQSALTFPDVYPCLVKLLYGTTVIIYNAAFDTARLAEEYERHQCAPIRYGKVECAMLQYAQFCGEWNRYYNTYRWQKLPDGDHSAMGDCRATLQIIEEMAAAPLPGEQKNTRVSVPE